MITVIPLTDESLVEFIRLTAPLFKECADLSLSVSLQGSVAVVDVNDRQLRVELADLRQCDTRDEMISRVRGAFTDFLKDRK